ncbi:MAG: hypothetical protein IRZ07_21740 [Microbispora sp.]|nr:hypothetical protein [Microbispora sp.]
MAGNPENASVWKEADVWLDFSRTATPPANLTDGWDDLGWELAGLLSGDDGFVEAREEDVEDHFAWGGLLVRTTRANHKRTIAFTALEDNPVTFQLLNPGSTRTTAGGLITSEVYVPQSTPFAIGFETREGAKIKRRICSRAEVQEVGEITEAETALTTYAFTVAIYPDGDGLLWTDIVTAPTSGS